MEQTVFQERLKRAMFLAGIRKTDLAERAGIDRGKVSAYVSGRYKPNAETLAKIAAALGVTPDWLLGREEMPAAKLTKPGIPGVGKVAAGMPILAQENILGYLSCDFPNQDLFALIIKGDSMSPRILDGDTVIVRRQETAEDGDLVIALIDDEATCKVFHRSSWGVTLVPFNTAFQPIILSKEAAEDLRILGVVVEHRHSWAQNARVALL